ncbi:MAG: dihydroneopterin aldolase [Thermoplasmata archaeon]
MVSKKRKRLDKIVVKNMAFYAFHGLDEEEAKQGQRFFIDVELYLDLMPAGLKDDIRLTTNYAKIYARVKELAQDRRFILIEALAESIASTLIKETNGEEVVVRVRKPSTPIKGILDYVEVEIHRCREDYK